MFADDNSLLCATGSANECMNVCIKTAIYFGSVSNNEANKYNRIFLVNCFSTNLNRRHHVTPSYIAHC